MIVADVNEIIGNKNGSKKWKLNRNNLFNL